MRPMAAGPPMAVAWPPMLLLLNVELLGMFVDIEEFGL